MIIFGYRFSKRLGIVFNWSSSSHEIENSNLKVKISYVGIGPMFTLPLNENFSLDIKLQNTSVF